MYLRNRLAFRSEHYSRQISSQDYSKEATYSCHTSHSITRMLLQRLIGFFWDVQWFKIVVTMCWVVIFSFEISQQNRWRRESQSFPLPAGLLTSSSSSPQTWMVFSTAMRYVLIEFFVFLSFSLRSENWKDFWKPANHSSSCVLPYPIGALPGIPFGVWRSLWPIWSKGSIQICTRRQSIVFWTYLQIATFIFNKGRLKHTASTQSTVLPTQYILRLVLVLVGGGQLEYELSQS